VVVRQFDVVLNGHNASSSAVPYFVILQHNATDALPNIIVAPVCELQAGKVISKLDVPIKVNNRDLFIRVHQMAAISRSQLRTVIDSRDDLHDQFIAAIDILFSGF
jgi:CcdB protein